MAAGANAMKAMILAAGKGTRMRELTLNVPKPMLRAAGKPLIEYQVEALVKAGIDEIVINHARFGEQIEDYLGDGSSWGARIAYSREGEEPLETAGGIIKALPLLGEGTFLAVNADVWTDFDYSHLLTNNEGQAKIILVENPDHNPDGDFALEKTRASNHGSPKYTFAGIGLYHSNIFSDGINESKLSLTPIIRKIADKQELYAELHHGEWIDVGTPERLDALRAKLNTRHPAK